MPEKPEDHTVPRYKQIDKVDISRPMLSPESSSSLTERVSAVADRMAARRRDRHQMGPNPRGRIRCT